MIGFYLILLGKLWNFKLYFKLLNFNFCGSGYPRYPPTIRLNITRKKENASRNQINLVPIFSLNLKKYNINYSVSISACYHFVHLQLLAWIPGFSILSSIPMIIAIHYNAT